MKANDVKRLKELEDENTKLKKLFAEVSLENHAMKAFFAKRLVVVEKKSCAQSLKEAGLSVIKGLYADIFLPSTHRLAVKR